MSKSAIVTGGVRGIGRGLVLKLAEMGYDVTTNYVSESSAAKAAELVAEVEEKYGRKVLAVQADVGTFEGCEATVNAAVAEFGDVIDVLVNNAGIINGKPFMESEPALFQKIINVDLLGTMNMSWLAIPHMIDHDASIINLSSVGMFCKNEGGDADYCAAKAGVVGFTRGIASDLGKKGVRVNAIAPGFIKTEILDGMDPEALAGWCTSIPMGRMGEVSDIAIAMEFLINSPFMTGQLINPNGGQVMY